MAWMSSAVSFGLTSVIRAAIDTATGVANDVPLASSPPRPTGRSVPAALMVL
jgi:hypothetical protein